MKQKDECILFFKIVLGKIVSAARNFCLRVKARYGKPIKIFYIEKTIT